MQLDKHKLDEINLLLKYKMESTQEGLKIHHTASSGMIDAAKRLFEKGLISQNDGGYLTDPGIEAAEYANKLAHLISPRDESNDA